MARIRHLVSLGCALVLASAAARADDDKGLDAVALFARNCAACHGLDGSGTGPSVLDRPAHNFKEGGFSFGNTVEAIERTLAHGIPGSPMPSFEGVLSGDERRALAAYVLTLGPPIKEVSDAETLVVVKDRPVIVRGILPALDEGGPVIPRGLLLGLPDGLTFQYDLQDVRLLAVRAGDFARRTDWGGRGGTPLEPLGGIVWRASASLAGQWLCSNRHGLDGEPLVGVPDDFDPLIARLANTRIGGVPSAATIASVLETADGRFGATLTDTPRGRAVGSASGFERDLVVQLSSSGPDAPWLALDLQPRPGEAGWMRLGAAISPLSPIPEGMTSWWSRPREDGSLEVLGVRAHPYGYDSRLPLFDDREGALRVILRDHPVMLRVTHLLAPAASDELTRALLASDA